MVIVAVRFPTADGSNITENVVWPEAVTEVAAEDVIAKSEALAPDITTLLIVKAASPSFLILKVRVTEPEETSKEPNLVYLEKVGALFPSPISVPFPSTVISGIPPSTTVTTEPVVPDSGKKLAPTGVDSPPPE